MMGVDTELEALIDEAGRDRVFDRAESYGWAPGSAPPKWVWWQIAQEVKAGVPPPRDSRSLSQVLFGFDLC